MQQMIFIADFIACSTCFGVPLCPSSGAPDDGHNGAPETCSASNKICNKNHLLHLVGILFPLKYQISRKSFMCKLNCSMRMDRRTVYDEANSLNSSCCERT